MISGKTKGGFKYSNIDERKFLTWEFAKLVEALSDEEEAIVTIPKYISFVLGPEQADALAAYTAKKNGGMSDLFAMLNDVNEILRSSGNDQTKKSSPLSE